jgi:hypothetical protein
VTEGATTLRCRATRTSAAVATTTHPGTTHLRNVLPTEPDEAYTLPMNRSQMVRMVVALTAFVTAFTAVASVQWFWELRYPTFYDVTDRASLVPSTALQWFASLFVALLASAGAWWLTDQRMRS